MGSDRQPLGHYIPDDGERDWDTEVNGDLRDKHDRLTHLPSERVEINGQDSPYSASFAELIFADTSNGAITIDLPDPGSGDAGSGAVGIIVEDSTNDVTVSRNGSEDIDGSASDLTLSVESAVVLVSEGTNWRSQSKVGQLGAVVIEDVDIAASDATNPASDGVADDAQLWVRGNSGSAQSVILRGTDDDGSGTDKAGVSWYHEDVDQVLASIVAHAADNHWSLYTTPSAAGVADTTFRKRLDVSGGAERGTVVWRNLDSVSFRPTDHADTGAGNFDLDFRRPTANDDTRFLFRNENAAAKFSIEHNEFDQLTIQDLTQPLTVFRMNEGDPRPALDAGMLLGGDVLLGQNPIRQLREVANASAGDLESGEFAFDSDRDGTGVNAWVFEDSGGTVHEFKDGYNRGDVTSTTHTASAWDSLWVDTATAAGDVTVTLPADADVSDGDRVEIGVEDATNDTTVSPNTGQTILGANPTLTQVGSTLTLEYKSSNSTWMVR